MYLPNCKLLTNNLLNDTKIGEELNFFLEGLQCRVPSDSWISFKLVKDEDEFSARLEVNSSTFSFSWEQCDTSMAILLELMKKRCDTKILSWHQARKVA